jgi:hypothetical protein
MRDRYDAARLPRIYPSDTGGQENERTGMGNLAVAQQLAGSDELDELFKLNATETEPEDDEDNEGDEDDEDGQDGGIRPEEFPH